MDRWIGRHVVYDTDTEVIVTFHYLPPFTTLYKIRTFRRIKPVDFLHNLTVYSIFSIKMPVSFNQEECLTHKGNGQVKEIRLFNLTLLRK